MMNPSQPMTSCDAANSWMMCGRFNALEHSEHVVEPLLWRYQSRRDCRSGWDLFSSSHLLIISANCSKASNLPPSGHCVIVSAQPLQLGHLRHLLSWWARKDIVPAMPRTCFAAQIWKSWGRSCSVRWTEVQSTASNWTLERIFGHGRILVLVDGVPKIGSDLLFPTSFSLH
jgi:hypothetical protein